MTLHIPTGFAALDLRLGGGLRREDLVVLGGDSGSGCSALALGIAVRAAMAGHRVTLLSTEMSAARLAERALALSAKATLDELAGELPDDARRAEIAAVALRLRALPVTFLSHAATVGTFTPEAPSVEGDLLVVDALEGLAMPDQRPDDSAALWVAALKRHAIREAVSVLLVVHSGDAPASRADRHPMIADFTASAALRQHADVILGLYREELYSPDLGVAGAAEVSVLKDRHGAGGLVDLYFTPRWLRFEDLSEE